MKFLVTGGAGFVGTNLIKRLLNENHEVVSVDNYKTGFQTNHQDGAEYFFEDIRLLKDYLQFGEFDAVFHLAAIARIQPSFKDPIDYFETNANGTMNICEYCSKNNIPLIYAGSSSHHSGKYKNPYTFSKDIGEEIVKLYQEHFNLKSSIARFYNVYGPHEITDGKWAAVIGKWRGQVEKNHPITIVGDGEQRRDFTHVDDIVDGLIRIAFGTETHDDAWELGTGFNYSLNEVADMFIQKFSAVKVYMTDEKGNYRETKRVNDDAINRLGWLPKDALKEYIENL